MGFSKLPPIVGSQLRRLPPRPFDDNFHVVRVVLNWHFGGPAHAAGSLVAGLIALSVSVSTTRKQGAPLRTRSSRRKIFPQGMGVFLHHGPCAVPAPRPWSA